MPATTLADPEPDDMRSWSLAQQLGSDFNESDFTIRRLTTSLIVACVPKDRSGLTVQSAETF